MRKNLIKDIARLLGLEIGKEFYVETKYARSRYRFTDTEIKVYDKEMGIWRDGSYIMPLLVEGLCDIWEADDKVTE